MHVLVSLTQQLKIKLKNVKKIAKLNYFNQQASIFKVPKSMVRYVHQAWVDRVDAEDAGIVLVMWYNRQHPTSDPRQVTCLVDPHFPHK